MDATAWENLEPLYRTLLERPIHCAGCLETLILDRSELDAAMGEAEANLYIAMTCHTDDQPARTAFLTFVEKVEPNLRRVGFELDQRITACQFVGDLDQSRYGQYLRELGVEVRLFRTKNVALATECTKLDQQYSQISGAMSVQFDGREQTLAQMARYLEETDRATRESAWVTLANRRLQDADQISALFDQMIVLRDQMGRNAGFANFRDFQHERMHRFDYAPADCFTFHKACEERVVPLMRRLHRERTQQLGLQQLRPWDLKVDVQGRPPLRPFEGSEQLVERTSRAYHRMDSELGLMFDSMRGGGCLDLESRKGKAPGGYQYQRQRSRTPFIFMNAAGLHRDLTTMVHEAGHAFHSILCKHDPLLAYRGSPMEFAEVASMSQELLTYPYLDEFYSPLEAGRARRDHLEGIISVLPWVATIDAFQQWIYTNPQHSQTERTEQWLQLHARFGAEASFEGHQRALETAWQRQLHLFGLPFYYIEYGIAQLGALQLWLLSRSDAHGALAGYKRALSLGGSKPLPQLFQAAGISFDFGPETVGRLVDEVERELTSLPL